MARAKKDGQFFNCYIEKELWDKISEQSEETKIPKTAIVEMALREYFIKNVDKQKGSKK